MNRAIKRLLLSLAGLAAMAAVAAVCLFAGNVYEDMLAEASVTPAPVPEFGLEGRPYGQEPETDIVTVDADYVYFRDRVLRRYYRDETALYTCGMVVRDLLDTLPDGVEKYLMLIPTRTQFEPDMEAYSDDQHADIALVNAMMYADVNAIDLVETLEPHTGEYIFFRTEGKWTSRGAYRAAQAFGEAAGITMRPLSDYEGHIFGDFRGDRINLPGHELDSEVDDYVEYFLLPGVANEQTITAREGPGDYRTYNSPTVALSRRGTDIFVGKYFSQSVMKGDGDGTLVILGDTEAKMVATWLTPYYENVVLISAKRYQGYAEEFRRIFEEYDVRDFIYMQSMEEYQSGSDNARIARLIPEENAQ